MADMEDRGRSPFVRRLAGVTAATVILGGFGTVFANNLGRKTSEVLERQEQCERDHALEQFNDGAIDVSYDETARRIDALNDWINSNSPQYRQFETDLQTEDMRDVRRSFVIPESAEIFVMDCSKAQEGAGMKSCTFLVRDGGESFYIVCDYNEPPNLPHVNDMGYLAGAFERREADLQHAVDTIENAPDSKGHRIRVTGCITSLEGPVPMVGVEADNIVLLKPGSDPNPSEAKGV